eukprot:7440313-Prorocentrum_lima.AAC.1
MGGGSKGGLFGGFWLPHRVVRHAVRSAGSRLDTGLELWIGVYSPKLFYPGSSCHACWSLRT